MDGGGGRGGAGGSRSGGGRDWGWRMRTGGGGNGKRGAVRGVRGTRTWDRGGVPGGAKGSNSGGSGALGGCGGDSARGSSGSERLRRGGAVGSVRAGGGRAAGGGGAGAPPFAGPGLVAGRVGPVRRRRRGLGGPRVVQPGTGGGGPPPSLDLPRRGAALVAAGGTGRVAVPGRGGPRGPFWPGRGGLADTVLFFEGRPLVVGGVVGWSARWVVLPSHALVLLVHGGLRTGGVGLSAVVVVVVVVVVAVVCVLVAVALVVIVMVLRVCPENPLAFLWGLGAGDRLQPLGPYGLVGSGGGSGAGLYSNRGRGSNVPGSVWPAAVVVCGGWMTGRLEMGLLTRVWTGSCPVAASVVAAPAWGEGGSGCGGWKVLAWVWLRV